MIRHPFLTSVTVGFDTFVQSWLTAYRILGQYILAMNKIRLTNAWNDLTSAGMGSSSALRYGVAAVLVIYSVISCQRWCSGYGNHAAAPPNVHSEESLQSLHDGWWPFSILSWPILNGTHREGRRYKSL